METIFIGDAIVTGTQLYLYYLLTFFALIYLIGKYRKSKFVWFIILIFFNGFFAFLGKNIWNIYKIFLVTASFWYLIRYKLLQLPQTNKIKFSFIAFSVSFVMTTLFNGDYFLIIFSQYSKYFILFTLFLFVFKYRRTKNTDFFLHRVIFDLLFIQIVLTVAKYVIIGPAESIVGSISSQGGAVASILPILGFMFIWLIKRGELKRNDWIFITGLMFIGFISYKRAIWFTLPFFIGAFLLYVPGKLISYKAIISGILAILFLFYLGVRLSPSLNKEGKIWGSFDFNYSIDYAQKYTFGNQQKGKDKEITGRGGATFAVINNFVKGKVSKYEWWGYGLKPMYTTDYEEFKELGFGLDHKGSATGLFQSMVTTGYFGIFFTLWFVFSLISYANNKRIRNTLYVFFVWEYFFYTGIVLREPSLSFLLVYLILFSDKYIKSIPGNSLAKQEIKNWQHA